MSVGFVAHNYDLLNKIRVFDDEAQSWSISGELGLDDLPTDEALAPKYMGMTGVETKMYNVLDIDRAGDWIGICEGELDTITLSACIGIPCIGVPGANSWKKHYTRLLADFERVFVFADGDQPGKEFASSLARELPVTVVQMPDEEDVNSCYVKYGSQYIRERMGLNEL